MSYGVDWSAVLKVTLGVGVTILELAVLRDTDWFERRITGASQRKNRDDNREQGG